MAINRPMPHDPNYPAYATDWKTGEASTDVVFRQGKWWNKYRWEHVGIGKDMQADLMRARRNRAVSRFLSNQPIAGL